MSIDNSAPFPAWALLPKRETNVECFLNKYPHFDGRGIKFAIFDSGIDPGAKGLQKTSDGKQKILEMIDASGAGDVDTSSIAQIIDGSIIGLTGRKLKVPTHWKNPSGMFHIGKKNAYELYPKSLKDRIIKERKEKFWNPLHKLLVAATNRKIQDFDSLHPVVNENLRLEKEELDAQLDVLNSLEKKYNDLGPTYDCIVFHDGDQWRAIIDTSEKGDLESCRLLGAFSDTYEYAMLTSSDRFNYCVNIYEDGNLLEIVGMSSSHGTHVASIAAAYFPDDPDKNGIAPGAQIISVCIGNIRLSSMETGTALIRGLIKVINNKCDVINMSYGEYGNWAGGRVIDLMHEAVNKHGIIMIASAGNNGPALSTVSMPATMASNSIIGVGAYVSPDMMLAEYSLYKRLPGQGYTSTSRGPGIDGSLGVAICAPGGAITSVPNWTLQGSQLKNGTSMSAPHVAGCISILLSGLKQKKIPYSPYSIRRAIENTAKKIETWEAFSMGHGLIQIEKAFDHLLNYSDCDERFVRFHVTCNQKNGIYLRESSATSCPSLFHITVNPIFMGNSYEYPEEKINFEMKLKLSCDAPYVSVPSDLCLMHASRTFTIRIDPSGLLLGEHFTWLKAYDSACIEKGPVFHFPITILISRKISNDLLSLNFPPCILQSGVIKREFFQVPAGATLATLQISSSDTQNVCNIVVHAVQLRPQKSCKSLEFHKTFHLQPSDKTVALFAVKGNIVLEVSFVPWWISLESAVINYNISFRGLLPDSPSSIMHGADGIHRIDVQSSLIYENLLPSVHLKSYVMILRPSDHKIKPLKSRDVIPNGRQVYEIVLTYTLIILRSTEITPNLSLLSELLYESEYESQLWMLFDANQQLLATGDAYPDWYTIKVEKGEYALKLQIRHEEPALLEKLSDVPMLVSIKLQSGVYMDIYDKHSNALVGGKKIVSQIVAPGSTVPIFLAPISNDKIPKNVLPGNYLSGNISFLKDEAAKKVDVYNFKYIIPELPKKASSSKHIVEKGKTLEEVYIEEEKQMKISWISKFTGKASEDLFNIALENHSFSRENHLQWPFRLARLQSMEKEYDKSSETTEPSHLLKMIKLADSILAGMNSNEILATLGSKTEKKDLNNYKKLEQQKNCIIEALVKKGKAMCNFLLKESNIFSKEHIKVDEEMSLESEKTSYSSQVAETEKDSFESDIIITLEKINEVYNELQKWCDESDSKIFSFKEKLALAYCHYGKAIKLLLKQQEEKRVIENEKKCIELFEKLGWDHCASFCQRSLFVKYPFSYPLF